MQLSNAKEIVLNQNAEWTRVMSDESERQSLLRYGMTLILIAYALRFLLSLLFASVMSAFVPYGTLYMVTSVVIEFALAIAALYFVPQILAALAPSFGGKNDSLNALKLYVFAATPAWLGMALSVIPVLGWLAAIAGGVYSIYLFWQHISDAMSIPAEKKVGYAILAVVIIVVIEMVIGAIGGAIAMAIAPYSFYHVGPFYH
ncbi:MAG TPA: Yip1 family protein [Candidatus Kapabacteria bacterium]|nr:Yip1 family protein [Candidatus Kapabacteria bacterium]